MLCILPFEEDFYREAGVSARYVGSPVVEQVPSPASAAAFRQQLGLPVETPTLALLPGSRMSEIRRILPTHGGRGEAARGRAPRAPGRGAGGPHHPARGDPLALPGQWRAAGAGGRPGPRGGGRQRRGHRGLGHGGPGGGADAAAPGGGVPRLARHLPRGPDDAEGGARGARQPARRPPGGARAAPGRDDSRAHRRGDPPPVGARHTARGDAPGTGGGAHAGSASMAPPRGPPSRCWSCSLPRQKSRSGHRAALLCPAAR